MNLTAKELCRKNVTVRRWKRKNVLYVQTQAFPQLLFHIKSCKIQGLEQAFSVSLICPNTVRELRSAAVRRHTLNTRLSVGHRQTLCISESSDKRTLQGHIMHTLRFNGFSLFDHRKQWGELQGYKVALGRGSAKTNNICTCICKHQGVCVRRQRGGNGGGEVCAWSATTTTST